MSQSSESDNEGHQGEQVEVIRLFNYISIFDMIEESQKQQLNVNDQVQDMNEVEESENPRQIHLSSMSEQEQIDNNESLIVEGSVSSNSLQQEAIETIQLTDQKQKKQIHSQIQQESVQNTYLIKQQQETLDITSPPQILQEEIGKQKKNRTKNIPRIYGGYLLKQWRGQIGFEWEDIQSQILKTIKDMKPKTLKDINFLRRYKSFREESVSYLESNKLLFDFLESEKIQDIQPLIEVMNQYYLSFKHNKKLINQTQGSQKRVKRD